MELVLSTSSLSCVLSNVYFHEKYLDDLICNENIFGIFYKNPITKNIYRHSILCNTNNKHTNLFNSQITLLVKADTTIYNVKLFRNGKIIITGYKMETDDILFLIINNVIRYIKENIIGHKDKDIQLTYYERNLQNYKCQYYKNINLGLIYPIIQKEKYTGVFCFRFMQYVQDRGGKIIIKMLSDDYKTTIKIFHSGKINIDGRHKREHAEKCQLWLFGILNNN